MYFVNESQEARPEYDEAIAYILDQLSQRLSDKLSYHSLEHTREIMAYSKMIGEREGISEEDMYLLQTAAAYHDSGFMYSPKEHEARGCQVVREVLPKFSFSEEHIMRIQKMIMATRIPQQPEDQLSRILCDADLYYLGTDDFYQTGNSLFEEFKGQGIVSSVSEWLQLQIRFLESHHYHTDTVIGECEERKQQHLAELREAFRQL